MKEKLFEPFRVPPDRADYVHFELNGDFQLIADGCEGILHFDENKLCLNCGKQLVEVEGERLSIRHLSENETEVSGTIKQVKLL